MYAIKTTAPSDDFTRLEGLVTKVHMCELSSVFSINSMMSNLYDKSKTCHVFRIHQVCISCYTRQLVLHSGERAKYRVWVKSINMCNLDYI